MKRICLLPLALVAALWGILAEAQTTNDKANFAYTQSVDTYARLLQELMTYYVDTFDVQETMNKGINYMLHSLDPYTEYLPEDESKEFFSHTTGEYAGIGSAIVERNGAVYISDPYEGKPAHIAGVHAGDKILKVDGDTVLGWTSAQVSSRLRGQASTPLKLTVERLTHEGTDTLEIEITREKIYINAVQHYGVVGDSIGYIYLSTFSDKAAAEVKQAFLDLKSRGIKSLMLDLRSNSGGLMVDAIQIINFFVPKGVKVLETKGKIRQWDTVYKTTQEPLDTEIPLAVLIDGYTASSSEIVAGALQDLDRAVIIGARSYGKGLVQQTRQLPYDNTLKVTIARYYIPSGRLIQAIDYTHRNPDGTAARIPDSLTNEFRTAGGRIVRDGGGIKPDIEPEVQKASNLSYYLYRDYLVSDFASIFVSQHDTIAPPEQFYLGDERYAQFKQFVQERNFKYDKQSSKALGQLKEVARFEGYLDDTTQALIDSLEAQLNHNIDKDLDTFRPEIEDMLTTEIAKRYYFVRGEMVVSQRNDSDVKAAIEILSDRARYEAILSPAAAR